MNITQNYQIADLALVSKEIIKQAQGFNLWTFDGEMGAGKTTLVKAICKELGVIDEVNSPTYSIVNEYETKSGVKVYHFDFYRIKDIEEAYQIGVEEYFESGCICIIEWPNKIKDILQHEKSINFFISINENGRSLDVLNVN